MKQHRVNKLTESIPNNNPISRLREFFSGGNTDKIPASINFPLVKKICMNDFYLHLAESGYKRRICCET